MAASKKVITRVDWGRKLNDVRFRKDDMNKLVMNFLVTEGYVDAAEKYFNRDVLHDTEMQLVHAFASFPRTFLSLFVELEFSRGNKILCVLSFSRQKKLKFDPKLPSLLKMLVCVQNQLDEKAAYPRINDFSTAALGDPVV